MSWLTNRFLSKGSVEHVAAGEQRPVSKMPGYVVGAMMAMAVVASASPANAASQDANATAQPVACTVTAANQASFAANVNAHRTAQGDAAIKDVLQRLDKSETGHMLLESAKANGVKIAGWPGLAQQEGLNGAFIPDQNTVLIDPNLGDNAPHILGHELYHAKGFHDGTGATIKLVDWAKISKESRVNSLVYEEAVAWTLQARISDELAHKGDSGPIKAMMKHAEFSLLANVYQTNVAIGGAQDGFRRAVNDIKDRLTSNGGYAKMYGQMWVNSSHCLENQQSNHLATTSAASVAPGVASAEALMATLHSQVGALTGKTGPDQPSAHFATPLAAERIAVGTSALATQPAVEEPSHPDGSHKASATEGGWVVRQRDETTGEYRKIGNPLGPAVVRNGKEAYAIDGEIMSKEEWTAHPAVVAAHEAAGLDLPGDEPERRGLGR